MPIFDEGAEDACAPPRTEDVGCGIDGDTFRLDNCTDGEVIRLLGLDTPEVFTDGPESCTDPSFYDDATGTCCYGTQASAFLKDLLTSHRDAEIRLEFDNTCTDTYERTLAYAWLLPEATEDTGEDAADEDDAIFINEELLAGGYARLYEFDTSIYRYQEFAELQSEARDAGLGLWGSCYE